MNEKKKKEIALEYIKGLMYGDWDEEMLSVHQMRKYKLTPEKYVEVTTWLNKKIKEMFGE